MKVDELRKQRELDEKLHAVKMDGLEAIHEKQQELEGHALERKIRLRMRPTRRMRRTKIGGAQTTIRGFAYARLYASE